MVFQYVKNNPDVEKRKNECESIKTQFPDKIPIICERDPNCKVLPVIDKTKYLVSGELTIAQFTLMIRKKIGVPEEESSFFLLVEGQYTITGDMILSDVYQKYKNAKDGFLYIAYTSAIIWGN